MNSEIRMTPSQASTICALRTSGGLKAGTPLETASVPVRATEPEAKARRMRAASVSGAGACASTQPGGGV